MKLYVVRISPCCRIVWLYCLRNNIQVEIKDVDLFGGEHKSPEFLKLNPHAEVPVLEDGETSVFEACAILRYLACKYTNNAEFGVGIAERMKTLSLVTWASTELHRVVGYRIVYPQFFEKHRLCEEANEALIEKGTHELTVYLEGIENYSLAGTQYLGSDVITMGDLYVATILIQLEWIEFDLSLWPNLTSWLDRIKTAKHWNTVHEKHSEFMKQLFCAHASAK